MTSELLDRLLLADEFGSAGSPGTFVRKTVRGSTYWYVQHPGRKQVYFGPDNEQEARRRADLERVWAGKREAAASRRDLCTMLRAGQVLPISGALARVVLALHGAGLHKTGAVVVGTHAFLAYQGLLGVKWSPRLSGTLDVDLASARRIEIVQVEHVDLASVHRKSKIALRSSSLLAPLSRTWYYSRSLQRVRSCPCDFRSRRPRCSLLPP
ncbi:MAG: hypothetical protein FJ100_22330 [Deltaproteobacteria bacterium]|nr:hypothetical protein [Deltaproteobacteria bacterium]